VKNVSRGAQRRWTELDEIAQQIYATQLIYSGPSSYDRLDIRTTWLRPKILVLTYDQSLELRPSWRS
jgi:hypothetical protein